MKRELREFINQARLCRTGVESVAGMLPEDDAELDSLIEEAESIFGYCSDYSPTAFR